VTRDQVLDVTAGKAKKVFIEDIPSAYFMATARFGPVQRGTRIALGADHRHRQGLGPRDGDDSGGLSWRSRRR